jgi:hypothetical protein
MHRRCVSIVVAAAGAAVFAGCSSASRISVGSVPRGSDRSLTEAARTADASVPQADSAPYIKRVGDAVTVSGRTADQLQFDFIVDQHRLIKLPLGADLRAASLTGSELERLIRSSSLNNRIYLDVTSPSRRDSR